MSSISQVVRSLVRAKPMVYEGLVEGIVSHAALAESLQSEIEHEIGKAASLPAIVMAIRRYSETIDKAENKNVGDFKFKSEIIMKTGLSDLTLVKTQRALARLVKLYSLVDYDRGDTLNIIHGNYEVSIVITEKYLAKAREILKGERVLNVEKGLVSLSVSFSSDFLHTPGVLSKVARKLAWESINVYENISTMTELIYIIRNDDAVRAYKALNSLIEGR